MLTLTNTKCGKLQPIEDFEDTRRSCRQQLARRRGRPAVSGSAANSLAAGGIGRNSSSSRGSSPAPAGVMLPLPPQGAVAAAAAATAAELSGCPRAVSAGGSGPGVFATQAGVALTDWESLQQQQQQLQQQLQQLQALQQQQLAQHQQQELQQLMVQQQQQQQPLLQGPDPAASRRLLILQHSKQVLQAQIDMLQDTWGTNQLPQHQHATAAYSQQQGHPPMGYGSASVAAAGAAAAARSSSSTPSAAAGAGFGAAGAGYHFGAATAAHSNSMLSAGQFGLGAAAPLGAWSMPLPQQLAAQAPTAATALSARVLPMSASRSHSTTPTGSLQLADATAAAAARAAAVSANTPATSLQLPWTAAFSAGILPTASRSRSMTHTGGPQQPAATAAFSAGMLRVASTPAHQQNIDPFDAALQAMRFESAPPAGDAAAAHFFSSQPGTSRGPPAAYSQPGPSMQPVWDACVSPGHSRNAVLGKRSSCASPCTPSKLQCLPGGPIEHDDAAAVAAQVTAAGTQQLPAACAIADTPAAAAAAAGNSNEALPGLTPAETDSLLDLLRMDSAGDGLAGLTPAEDSLADELAAAIVAMSTTTPASSAVIACQGFDASNICPDYVQHTTPGVQAPPDARFTMLAGQPAAAAVVLAGPAVAEQQPRSIGAGGGAATTAVDSHAGDNDLQQLAAAFRMDSLNTMQGEYRVGRCVCTGGGVGGHAKLVHTDVAHAGATRTVEACASQPAFKHNADCFSHLCSCALLLLFCPLVPLCCRHDRDAPAGG